MTCSLYNSIWLVVNDILLGMALGAFLYLNIPMFVEFISSHINVTTFFPLGLCVSIFDIFFLAVLHHGECGGNGHLAHGVAFRH